MKQLISLFLYRLLSRLQENVTCTLQLANTGKLMKESISLFYVLT